MDTQQLAAAADELDTDDFADILQQLPATISTQVLSSLDCERPGPGRSGTVITRRTPPVG